MAVPAQTSASTPGNAAASASSDAATAGPGSPSGEIIVTARKRSESLRDVPISISAITGDALTRRHIISVQDIQNSVPNLQYSPRGDFENQIYIRGVGGDPRNIGIESGVSLYIDGVYTGRTAGYNQDLANVSQIEVLRGPQGTLFGKNTTGGVINIITEKPSDTLRGMFDGSYGNYNAVNIKGSVSGPLTANLFAGVTLAATQRDGYIHNLFDGRKLQNVNRRGGRLQLVWNAPFAAKFYWTADRTVSDGDLIFTQLAPPYTGNAAPYGAVSTRFNVSFNTPSFSELKTTGVAQTVEFGLPGDHTLTSVTAYRTIYANIMGDSDDLPIESVHAGPFTDQSRLFTQELRISSPDRGLLRYVVGAYYSHQHAFALRQTYIGGSLANGYNINTAVNTSSVGLFANVDLHFTSRLTVTGGVRYTSEKKNGYFHQISVGKNYTVDDLHRNDHDVSWTGSVNYRLTNQLSLYGTASRGFKSGGFNVDAVSAAGIPPASLSFKPENLTNFEVGAKGRLLDGALTFTADAFYDNFANKQVAQFLGTGYPTTSISNAGKARIKGFEIEASAHPTALWTIDGSVSRLHTRYLSFPNAAIVNGAYISYTGNRLEGAPNWSANGSIDRRQPIGFGYLTARVEGRWTGSTYFQPDNLAINLQKGYFLYGGRIGVETESGKTSLSVFGKNLGNKGYFVFSRSALGTHQVNYGEPRTYGIELTQRF